MDITNPPSPISKTAQTGPLPVTITFRHMDPSPAVADRITVEAQKLPSFFPRLAYCDVVVIAPHQHHRHGTHFSVHLELGVPGERLAISHLPPALARISTVRRLRRIDEVAVEDKDIFVVIRHAFDAARRRLKIHGDRRRRRVTLDRPASISR